MNEETDKLTFEKFPKLGRLNRGCVITEKVDGTNGSIVFSESGDLLVGSKNREIFPEGGAHPKGCDNYGFAGWVYANRDILFSFLGQGRHFGEWSFGKIQRGYGIKEKQFLLFNAARFGPGNQEIPEELRNLGLGVVPTLYAGVFSSDVVNETMRKLLVTGSRFNSYPNPEGVVVYHVAIKKSFKVTYEHDDIGKGPGRQDHG